MKRLFSLFVVLCFVVGVAAVPAMAGNVVKIKPNDPIHIAYWFVISGPNTSLGQDTVRGIEMAMDDFGGKIKPSNLAARTPSAVLKAGRRLHLKSLRTPPWWRPSVQTARVRPNPVCRFSGRWVSPLFPLPIRHRF